VQNTTVHCRKLLRYEAAELVRSLQSSRTSLEKAGLGGSSHPGSYSGSGTLGRRLGRPYSPALNKRREVVSPGLASPGPMVESPLSPHNSSAPASLSQGVTRAFQVSSSTQELIFLDYKYLPRASSWRVARIGC
jgi:hypothetical protein